MKKNLLIVVTFIVLFIGCNINPNKEERIQKLETEIQMATDKVNELESRVQTLEVMNKELNTRIQNQEKS